MKKILLIACSLLSLNIHTMNTSNTTGTTECSSSWSFMDTCKFIGLPVLCLVRYGQLYVEYVQVLQEKKELEQNTLGIQRLVQKNTELENNTKYLEYELDTLSQEHQHTLEICNILKSTCDQQDTIIRELTSSQVVRQEVASSQDESFLPPLIATAPPSGSTTPRVHNRTPKYSAIKMTPQQEKQWINFDNID